MTLSLYDMSIPAFIRAFKQLSQMLDKAETFTKEQAIDSTSFLTQQLDQHQKPILYYVQIASNTAKGFASRVTGVENIFLADTENTFEELHARIDKTVTYLETFKREQFDGKEAEPATLPTVRGDITFPTGQEYLSKYALPHFYMQITLVYVNLQRMGVPLVNRDYIGPN